MQTFSIKQNLSLSRLILLVFAFLHFTHPIIGQEFFNDYTFSRYDSLRGALNPMRTCYDVNFYDLNLKVNPGKKAIKGYNTIHFTAQSTFDTLQIDLFNNLAIDSIVFNGKHLEYVRDSHFVFVVFPKPVKKGFQGNFSVHYGGKPVVAPNPPWDGGFVWNKDEKGRYWIGVACEGTGASLWWPNKDHLSEEPDSMAITCQVPDNLMCVANGDLRSKKALNGNYEAYHWFVENPIDNYNVTLNIADYRHFRNYFKSKGSVDSFPLDYYVLPYNLSEAKKHFQQVPEMLNCFEKFFGPYPFPEDGYALVETPYWGMEHQSAIAYGNDYRNNRWGFDYIIVHETGHEWWGNSVSTRDHGALWIHESFTTYMESLYVECRYDSQKAIKYLQSQKERIRNQHPILGPTQVNYNQWPASDMYYKGAWMLHTLRNSINNDSLWFSILKGLTSNFYHSVVNSDSIIHYINQRTPKDYTNFFRQYLKFPDPPIFYYKIENINGQHKLHYAWKANTDTYNYPLMIKININGKTTRINPTKEWQSIKWPEKIKTLKVRNDAFYVKSKKIK